MSHNFRIVLVQILLCMPFYIFASEELQPIHSPLHQQALAEYKKNAEDFCAKNLNKFGLSQLWRYDHALDSMYGKEMADTVVVMRNNYDASYASRNAAIEDLNDQIKVLTSSRDQAQSLYSGLLRKTVLASLIWLAVVLILMKVRSRTLKRIQLRLGESDLQLRASENLLGEGIKLISFIHKIGDDSIPLASKAEELKKKILENPQTKENLSAEESEKLKAAVQRIHSSAALSSKLASALLSQQPEQGSEKTSVNLNSLCDKCFDLVYYGLKCNTEEFRVTVSKDLEKNLPAIKIIPEAIIQLLINVILNAFQSVLEKQEKKITGYIPRVTVSTRILPRFLQIRVKDNGDGMPDAIIRRAGESFFTTKNLTHASGLGMYYVKKISGEQHQGEIKIESEPGNSTDVYIKFFTS